jgi:dTDP-4-dehydro-6-deoxy-alpha-D-glucopyranose 2,3-dehydratase
MTEMTELTRRERTEASRIMKSAMSGGGPAHGLEELHRWFAEFGRSAYTVVERAPLDRLAGWSRDPESGNIGHHSGKFFTVEGLDVRMPSGPVERWSQPIIVQPEIGILGILVKEFGGVLHCLMQAKVEPGNRDGLQLSPTVQATRSNYTRVHQGRPVPYLDYFRGTARHRVIADVRQSEQGAWFDRKRNRNMVVEVVGDVEPVDGFRWLTLGQVYDLLAQDDLVNMDARTVLSCLPLADAGLAAEFGAAADGFASALIRSCDVAAAGLHGMHDILRWITEARTRTDVFAQRIPLGQVRDWRFADGKISHESGRFFDVIGMHVTAGDREVGSWSQPMIEPYGTGVVAFLVRNIGGVLHVLMNARVEPGYVDVVELGPTVQCTPENYDVLPAAARPRFLDDVLRAGPGQIRFEALLSEEGGRFYHALNRYLIIETDTDVETDDPDFRWMTLSQLVFLLRHSHYLNVQARSLVTCLHSRTARMSADR